MNRQYVLDANAVLDFVEGGPGAPRVREIVQEAFRHAAAAFISVANWGEVFYTLWERRGEEKARSTLSDLLRLPIQLVPVDLEQALKAGEIKAAHKIPYVDCLAAALAELRNAVLVTSDRDFEKLGRRVRILWIVRR
jgi:predicted nucleic acid-binding protein